MGVIIHMGIRKYRKSIGKYIAANCGTAIFRIEDCYISSRNKCAYFLLWNIRKKEYLPIMCIQVFDTSLNIKGFTYISAEDANKVTLKYGYDCIKDEYFLTNEQKKELEKSYESQLNC